MRIIPIVLAGGRGQRFWPYSTIKKPKQFLSINGKNSLLFETFARLKQITGSRHIHMIANKTYKNLIKKDIPTFNFNNFIEEPVGRDTAPAILLASKLIDAKKDDVFYISPADHYIGDMEGFKKNINLCAETALNKDVIVTLGIIPKRADTGYGYIELGPTKNNIIYNAKNFREKPDLKMAEKYYKSGKFIWNAGMFFFTKATILKSYGLHASFMLEDMENYLGEKNASKKLELFNRIEKTSFDYAIMENHKRIKVVKANFDWDDLGSWNSLKRISDSKDNNYIEGNVYAHNAKNVVVKADKNIKIVINGLDNINVIKKDDLLYVTSSKRESDIKYILKKLEKEKDFAKYL